MGALEDDNSRVEVEASCSIYANSFAACVFSQERGRLPIEVMLTRAKLDDVEKPLWKRVRYLTLGDLQSAVSRLTPIISNGGRDALLYEDAVLVIRKEVEGRPKYNY